MRKLLVLLLIGSCTLSLVNRRPLSIDHQGASEGIRNHPGASPKLTATVREADLSNGGEWLYGSVVGVLDGETVTFLNDQQQERVVHLYGIDAPEKSQRYGYAAAFKLERLTENQPVLLEIIGWHRTGACFGILYTDDGDSINERLLISGVARNRVTDGVVEGHQRAESIARRAGIGIWAAEKYEVPTFSLSNLNSVPTFAFSAPKKKSGQSSTIVFITEYGSKYHRSGCKHLLQSRQEVSLDEVRGAYAPCLDCEPPL